MVKLLIWVALMTNAYFVIFRQASNSVQGPNASGSSPVTRVDIFRKLRSRIDDDFEMKLMRAEGVYAHGFFAAACDLAVDLANKMLQNPPNLLPTVEPVPTASVKVRVLSNHGGFQDLAGLNNFFCWYNLIFHRDLNFCWKLQRTNLKIDLNLKS